MPRYRPLEFGVTRGVLREGAAGVRYLQAETAAGRPTRSASPTGWLHWAEAAPERTFMARRERQRRRQHRRLAARELRRGAAAAPAASARPCSTAASSAERPVAILSENGLEHALLALGCLYAGVPYCPVSPRLLHW